MTHRAVEPVIVGGCHRSGTSLLRRILNAHSRIYCGPEVKFFRDFFGDYPSDPLKHARFSTSARTMLPEPEVFRIMGRAFVEMHVRACELYGKTRWADKCPENALYLDEWQVLLGDDWLFVHVIRNPHDTLSSMAEAGFPVALPATLPERIGFWKRYTLAGIEFAKRHPHRYIQVEYDELVSQPEATLTRLMSCLGETFERTQMNFNEFEHQTGLEDPKVRKTVGIHTQSVGRGAAQFAADELEQITEGTAEVWRCALQIGRQASSDRDQPSRP